MHIRAIPNDSLGAMRVIQYFVHSSMVAINRSIYNSSEYGRKTDEQWEEIKNTIKTDSSVDDKLEYLSKL